MKTRRFLAVALMVYLGSVSLQAQQPSTGSSEGNQALIATAQSSNLLAQGVSASKHDCHWGATGQRNPQCGRAVPERNIECSRAASTCRCRAAAQLGGFPAGSDSARARS